MSEETERQTVRQTNRQSQRHVEISVATPWVLSQYLGFLDPTLGYGVFMKTLGFLGFVLLSHSGFLIFIQWQHW